MPPEQHSNPESQFHRKSPFGRPFTLLHDGAGPAIFPGAGDRLRIKIAYTTTGSLARRCVSFYAAIVLSRPIERWRNYNDSVKILFLHGWQSVPGGVKPTFLAQHGHTVINPRLPDEHFEEAVKTAQTEFDKHQPQVVVGSSRGGAVAMNINSGDAKLVLLCPAWRKHGAVRTVKQGTTILHSRADDVVPFAGSEELIRKSGLPTSALVEVGRDHRLADPEPLAAMLRACAG
jgi:hypothetical protein